jgi:hypothetical protein
MDGPPNAAWTEATSTVAPTLADTSEGVAAFIMPRAVSKYTSWSSPVHVPCLALRSTSGGSDGSVSLDRNSDLCDCSDKPAAPFRSRSVKDASTLCTAHHDNFLKLVVALPHHSCAQS